MQWLSHILAFCIGLIFAAAFVSSWLTETFVRYRTSLGAVTKAVLDGSVNIDQRVERISALGPALIGSGLVLLFKLTILLVVCVLPLLTINAIGIADEPILGVSMTQLVVMGFAGIAYVLYSKFRP